MATQISLRDRKSKMFLEEYLTNGFKDYSPEKLILEIVNVDIMTMIDGDLTTLILSYKDTVVNTDGNLEDKYFTKHILIDSNLNLITNQKTEDVAFLNKLLDEFKKEYSD